MKNKKLKMYIWIILLVFIILLTGYIIYININAEEPIMEYTPEEEITDEQLRQTIINLYFSNKESGEIEVEKRKIDAKELLDEPYKKIIELLILGPENEELINIIPEGTQIKNINLTGNVLTIEFLNEQVEEGSIEKEKIKESITNTLSQFIEVEKIIIKINDEEI